MGLHVDRIQKSVRTVRRILGRASKRPTPDVIHDLRTHARRSQSVFESLSLRPTRHEQQMLRDLKRVRKAAGKVRDMDVLTAAAAGLHADAPHDCHVQLLEYLGFARYRHARRLRRIMRRSGPTLRRDLRRVARRVDGLLRETGSHQGTARANVSTELATTARELSNDLAAPSSLDRTNLHDFRLKIRALRYILEMADDPSQQEFVETLRAVKDAIGEWHDWEELIELATGVLDHGPRCELMAELETNANQRFDRALALANSMRQRYVPAPAGKPAGPSNNGHADGRTPRRSLRKATMTLT